MDGMWFDNYFLRRMVMRNMIKKLFVSVFVIVILTMSAVPAWASDIGNFDLSKMEKNIKLRSDGCPNEALSYALSAFPRLLESAIESGSVYAKEGVSLGTPFTIQLSESTTPVYYFPIVSGGTFIGTFRVYQDSMSDQECISPVYTGIISPHIIKCFLLKNQGF